MQLKTSNKELQHLVIKEMHGKLNKELNFHSKKGIVLTKALPIHSKYSLSNMSIKRKEIYFGDTVNTFG